MKLFKTIVSIVFLGGTVAIIVIDSQKDHAKMQTIIIKKDSSKIDSLSNASMKK